jgi:hypothetical protein
MDSLARRRDAEFAACEDRHQVDRLLSQWESEDEARQAAQSWQQKQVADLCRRVARLEQERAALIGAIGQVLPKYFSQEFKKRCPMTYAGIWDESKTYDAGSVCTDKGASWVAVTDAAAGARPGRDVAWRLCAKGGQDGQQFA